MGKERAALGLCACFPCRAAGCKNRAESCPGHVSRTGWRYTDWTHQRSSNHAPGEANSGAEAGRTQRRAIGRSARSGQWTALGEPGPGSECPWPGVVGVCRTRMDGGIRSHRRPAIIGGQSSCSAKKWEERRASAYSMILYLHCKYQLINWTHGPRLWTRRH